MWFIKKRYTIAESKALDGMTDTHSHLLWMVDDGSKGEQSSRDMILGLQELGVKGAFATPHIMAGLPQNNAKNLSAVFDERLGGLRGELDFETRLAGEYMMDESFFPKLKSRESLLTYDGTHLLVEMSHLSIAPLLSETLFEMYNCGYVPVMAHPERYSYIANMDDYEMLKARGCKFQLNLLSLSDAYGRQVRRDAQKLLDADMYDFVGTDIHSLRMLKFIKEQKITTKICDQLAKLVANNDSLKLKF